MSLTYSSPPIERCAAEAAALVRAAFAPPAMEMDEAYLRWALSVPPTTVALEEPITVMGRDEQQAIAFFAATIRPFRLGTTRLPIAIPSFLSVAPGNTGRGYGREVYRQLLGRVLDRQLAVLTFAVEGSRGAALIAAAYPEAGFTGGMLETEGMFGAIGPRRSPKQHMVWQPTQPVLELDRSEFSGWLRGDPRELLELDIGGALAVLGWQRTATGRRPLILLEQLPLPLTSESLAAAISKALELGARHSRQLVVAALPGGTQPLALAAGLRRLPGAPFRPWLWVPAPDHPAAGCRSVLHPVF